MVPVKATKSGTDPQGSDRVAFNGGGSTSAQPKRVISVECFQAMTKQSLLPNVDMPVARILMAEYLAEETS